jgi:enoyl-CoA hydratase
MAYTHLLLDVSERIATLTINRPRFLNALSPAVMEELEAALAEAEGREDIGVVLLTGAGEKAFVAGADIAAMEKMTPVQALSFALAGQRVLERIETMEKAVIAVVNGFALGGGCELAMACDMIVASEEAVFGQPEVSLGIIPGYGGTQRLSRLVGRNTAKELVLTGMRISAGRAFALGLANRVVPKDRLMDEARSLAHAILKNAQAAAGLAKRAMNRGLDLDLPSACALEAHAFAAAFATGDAREGLRAFLEKRKPDFTGR